MSRAHAEYEWLCGLDAVEQLSAEEANDLRDHTESCPSCHQRSIDMKMASYAYFTHHASNAERASLPAGMQERFEERAIRAGIPVRTPTAAMRGPHVFSLALSVLVLILSAQVSWKALSPRFIEGSGSHFETPSSKSRRAVPAAPRPLIADARPDGLTDGSLKRTRHPGRPPRAVPSGVWRGAKGSDRYSVLYDSVSLQEEGAKRSIGEFRLLTVEGVRSYASSGLRLPAKRTFELTSVPGFSVPGFSANGARALPHQQAFRYNPKLASVTFLGSPERVTTFRLPAMNDASLFRNNSNQPW